MQGLQASYFSSNLNTCKHVTRFHLAEALVFKTADVKLGGVPFILRTATISGVACDSAIVLSVIGSPCS